MTSATTNEMCKENWQKRHSRQEDHNNIGQVTKGNFFPADMPPPGKHQNNMLLSGLEVHHPAYERLLKYATGGFPVKNGRDWTKEEIHAAVMRVPHESALSDDTIAHFAAEAKVKMASKLARLVLYDNIKGNIPKK